VVLGVITAGAAITSVVIAQRASDEATRQTDDLKRIVRPRPATKATVYTPPTATDAQPVADITNGYCPFRALTTDRIDAYRCFGDGPEVPFVLDPCFRYSTAPLDFVDIKYMYCPAAPGSRDPAHDTPRVVQLREALPIGPPPNDPDPPRALAPQPEREQPWALLLSNGLACRYVEGYTGIIATSRVNYLCLPLNDNFQPSGYVLGFPNRDSSTWTVLFSQSLTHNFKQVDVRLATL
jgi:hypothetical protein